MDVVERVLRGSAKDVPYMVRGGRSYLAKIPTRYMKVLSVAVPEFFAVDASDWNVLVWSPEHAATLLALLQKAFKLAKRAVTVVDTSTPDIRRKALVCGDRQVANILDGSTSAVGNMDADCGPSVLEKGIKYSSLCDCLYQLNRALSSTTFAKREKTSVRCRVILNAYRDGLIAAASTPRLKSVVETVARALTG